MTYICNFYAHQKEAVSNQLELLRSHVGGNLFTAGIFLNQQHLSYEDICQKRIILPEQEFIRTLPNFVKSLPKDESIHYFSEEPELDKLKIFNSVPNLLYISMYRKPTKEYASFLKEFKNLARIYVELDSHKRILSEFGIDPDKIIVSYPPSIFERSFFDREFTGKFLFASWNGGDFNSLAKRGLIAILDLLELNTDIVCNILLRDNEINLYEEMIQKRGLDGRITLSKVNSYADLCKAFMDTDVVLFLTQIKLTKDVPNSIIDGFALGKPVVMTNVVDFAKIVTDYDMGWVINPGEVFDARIIKAKYKEMSQNAFKYCEKMTPSNYVKCKSSDFWIYNMKVLLVSLWSISNASIGGTERFVVDLAHLLSKKCSVTVLSLGSADLNIKNINVLSLNVVDRLNEHSLLKYLENGGLAEIEFKLKSFIKKNKFDVVHCNSLLFSNLVKNIPVIQTVHTNQEEFYNSFPANVASTILKNIENDKNAVYVAPSMSSMKSFQTLTRKTPLIITHGFRSDIVLSDKTSLKQKYGIPYDDIAFCVPSRLEIQQKGQEVLLIALQSIKQLLPSFTVVLGGCDEQYLENKKYLQKHYPGLKMLIEGFSDKSDMYSLSDVIILPSRTESFGYAAIESAMVGLPLFLSDIPPYREIAQNNPRIVLFKNNEIELARILLEKNDMILTHDIISPPKKWRDRYSEDTMLQKYLSLYSEVVSNFKH